MVRVALITLDNHVAGAMNRARRSLKRDIPDLELSVHAASDWNASPSALKRCHADIAEADLIVVTMLFVDEHVRLIIDQLAARRDDCAAMVCCMSASEVMRLTRMGKFSMSGGSSGPMKFLKKLKGGSRRGGAPSAGAKQLKMLKRIPKILKYIPGTAQDLRAYFLTMQYWLAASEDNLANMFRMLLERYLPEQLAAEGVDITA